MSSKCRISVIMPVFNGEKYLQKAIKSILNQSYRYFEFIIINDASTDRSIEIIKKFKDSRIRLFTKKATVGVADCLNSALRKTKAEFIARMDADDIAMPDRFEKQLHYLINNKKVGLVASAVEIINQSDQIVSLPKTSLSLSRDLLFFNPIKHSSVLFRKKLIDQYGFYDESLNGAEDYDLWLRLNKYTQIHCLPQRLIAYRISPSGVSFQQMQKVERAFCRAKIKSVFVYGYPYWTLLIALKSYFSSLIPKIIKQNLYRHFYQY